jgi:hypothetical protein
MEKWVSGRLLERRAGFLVRVRGGLVLYRSLAIQSAVKPAHSKMLVVHFKMLIVHFKRLVVPSTWFCVILSTTELLINR